MNDHQIFTWPLRVRDIMMAIPRLPRAGDRRGSLPHRRCLDVGVKDLQFRVQISLELGQSGFRLRFHLQMDRGVLRLLLRDLHLVRGDGLVGLRPRLCRQELRIPRRRPPRPLA